MGSQYKASIYNYIFNSINAFVIIINGIVMVPIYFNYMSVSTYGAWLATGNVVAMLGLLEGGFSFVITQKLSAAIAQKDIYRYLVLSGSNILTAFAIAFSILVLGTSISSFITDWINVEPNVTTEIRWAFILSVLATSISIFINLFGAFPQVWQDTKSVGMYNIISHILAIIALIIFLFCGFGVVSIALSYVVRAVLNTILYGTWIIKKWRLKGYDSPIFSIKDSIVLFKDCMYPLLSKIAGTVVGNSHSFVIAHFMNPWLAAVYDLTSKLCMVACSFVAQMNGAFFALFSYTLAEGNREKTEKVMYNSFMMFFVLLATAALYSMCFTKPIIYYWVGLDKYGGTTLLMILVVANVFAQIRFFLNSILYTGGLINKSAKYDILWMMLYIILLIGSIKYIQIFAIPVATLLSCFIFIWIYLKIAKNNLRLNANMIVLIFVRVFAIVFLFLVSHILSAPDYHNLLLFTIYFVIFTICYTITLFCTNRQFFCMLIKRFTSVH